jgi:hypothetical protein
MVEPDPFEAQRQFERMFNLQPWQIYCDDYARDVSLEDRASRVRTFVPEEGVGEIMGGSITNFEEGYSLNVNKEDWEILYDKSCVGCATYNSETGEVKVISQKKFEKAYIESRVKEERAKYNKSPHKNL